MTTRTAVPRAGLMTAALVAAAATPLVWLLATHTSRGRAWDRNPVLGRVAPGSGFGTFQDRVDVVSTVLIAVTAAAVLMLAARRRARVPLVAAAAAVLGAALTTQLLKVLFALGAGGAFPSGHTTTAVALALTGLMLTPPPWRGPCAVAAALVGTAVGVGVLVAGWHSAADVLGGIAVALAWVAGTAAVATAPRPAAEAPAPPPLALAGRASLLTLGVVAIALGGERGASAGVALVGDAGDARRLLLPQALVIGAVAAAAALVLVALLDARDLPAGRG